MNCNQPVRIEFDAEKWGENVPAFSVLVLDPNDPLPTDRADGIVFVTRADVDDSTSAYAALDLHFKLARRFIDESRGEDTLILSHELSTQLSDADADALDGLNFVPFRKDAIRGWVYVNSVLLGHYHVPQSVLLRDLSVDILTWLQYARTDEDKRDGAAAIVRAYVRRGFYDAGVRMVPTTAGARIELNFQTRHHSLIAGVYFALDGSSIICAGPIARNLLRTYPFLVDLATNTDERLL